MTDAAVTNPGHPLAGATRPGTGSRCAEAFAGLLAGGPVLTRTSRPCRWRSTVADGAQDFMIPRTRRGRDTRVTASGSARTAAGWHVARSLSRGFTLVEVLAALLLVAIVVPVVMRGVTLATSAASSAKRRIEAASLAQSKMAEVLATERWRGGVLSGSFDAADGHNAGDYAWRADVTPWTEAYVKQLAVNVSWDRTNAERSVTLTTLVYEGRPEDDDDDANGDEPADDEAAAGGPGGTP